MAKILVIDDEPIVRLSLKRACESRGHEVLVAEDGQEGQRLWTQENPDLVFLDVIMPGLTGPELLAEVGAQSAAKVILMSAYTGEYNVERARSIGADLFIPKPFADIFKTLDEAENLL